MNPLSTTHLRHIAAAEGWMGLGSLNEAPMNWMRFLPGFGPLPRFWRSAADLCQGRKMGRLPGHRGLAVCAAKVTLAGFLLKKQI